MYSAAKTRSHGIAKLLYLQSALVPCLCKSGLRVAKVFGASASVLSTLKKCFVFVGDTMMCVCKFTNATLLHVSCTCSCLFYNGFLFMKYILAQEDIHLI